MAGKPWEAMATAAEEATAMEATVAAEEAEEVEAATAAIPRKRTSHQRQK